MVTRQFFNPFRCSLLAVVAWTATGCGGDSESEFDTKAESEKMIKTAVAAEGLEIGVRYQDLFRDAMLRDPKTDSVGSRRAIDRFLLLLQKYDAPRPAELQKLAARILPDDRPSTKEQEEKRDRDVEDPPEEAIYRAVESMATAFDKYQPPPTPIEYLRYRTSIEVAFDESPEYSGVVRDQVRQDIDNMVSRTWGKMWRPTVVENNWLVASPTGLRQLDPKDLIERYPYTEVDKVFFLTVQRVGATDSISAVEWDSSGRVLTEMESEISHDPRMIGDAARRLMIRIFRPVLKLYTAEFKQIELRLMGGEYPAPDPAAAQVVVRDIVLPFLRYRNRKEKEKVEKIQLLPLNYVVINRVERGRVMGTHINPAGSYSPFGGKARGVDQLGLRQRPRVNSSSVKLVLRDRPERPLVCHRVEVIPKLTVRDENLAESTHMLSDRHGRVTITRDPGFTNFWIYIRSGEFKLAKVPYVPGLTASDTVELPDDSVRLRVEGELSMLRGKLLDSVARRATFMAEATGAAKAGKWEEVQAALVKIDEMPGQAEFEGELNAIEVPAVEQTTAMRQRFATSEIKKKCSAVTQILKRFFDPKKAQEFREKLKDTYDGAVAGNQ